MKTVTRGNGVSDHLPQPRITVGVKEKPTQFLVDTGAQHSVFQANGTVSKKRSWVQEATGTKMYSWTTRRTVDLGMGWVAHSFRVTLDRSYSLLE